MTFNWSIAIIIKRVLMLFVLISLLTACSGLFFYPKKSIYTLPSDFNLAFQDVYIDVSAKVRIHGWWLPSKVKAKGTVYFLHGNAENITSHIRSVAWLPEAGYQVLLIDYRGYGKSTGVAVLPDVFLDINAGFDWLELQDDVNKLPLYVFGQSLGASMVGYLVSKEDSIQERLSGVILDSGFSSYSRISKEVAQRHWLTWSFQYPVAWSMPSDYDLIDVIGDLDKAPLLIMHSHEDRVIPYHHAEALYDKASGEKSFIGYYGRHISAMQIAVNRKRFLSFLSNNSKG